MFYLYFTGIVITPVTRLVSGVAVALDRHHIAEMVTDSFGVVLSSHLECHTLSPAPPGEIPRVLAFGDDPELIDKP